MYLNTQKNGLTRDHEPPRCVAEQALNFLEKHPRTHTRLTYPMTDVASSPRPLHPANRLQRLGYNVPRNVGRPLTTLDARQRLIIEYMTHGCAHDRLVKPFGFDTGVPLSLDQAADVVGIRRRNARNLSKTPIFAKALAKANADLRNGAHTKAIHRMIDLIDEPGAGKAADRKVQLAAAQAVIGEEGKAGTTVNVNVAQQQITPGYVIKPFQGRDAQQPAQPTQQQAVTINSEPTT
jgi:hypothetical protein